MPNDVEIMLSENKKNPKWKDYKGNYFIFSKEDSNFYVLNNKHQIIDSVIAGRGKDKGDYPNTAKAELSKEQQVGKRTTPAGRYAIKSTVATKKDIKDYDTPFYEFEGNEKEGYLGFHGIYKDELEVRTKILNNKYIKDKLVSWGCINIPKEFLAKQNISVGDSLFITKEPNLILANKNGK